MAIQINGNGTITGISVGGLPDGIVDTDMIANNAVTNAKATGIAGGKVLQTATGDQAPKTGTNLTFNSATGALGATSYTGDGSSLTGVASTVADGCIYENSQTISNNYTITTNKNAMSAGPITIASGATLTVPSGSVYTIV